MKIIKRIKDWFTITWDKASYNYDIDVEYTENDVIYSCGKIKNLTKENEK